MPTMDYRRELSLKETLPAVGAGVGAGLAVFYLARLMLQRTPLVKRRELVPGAAGHPLATAEAPPPPERR